MRFVFMSLFFVLLSSQTVGQTVEENSNFLKTAAKEEGHKELKAIRNAIRLVFQKESTNTASYNQDLTVLPTEDTRAVAICLTVALGVFGAHRIYLGTADYVPIFYTLTLGGGLGILPLVDLFHLCLTKDISTYYNNDRLIMWGGN